jgi:hypothetical protein
MSSVLAPLLWLHIGAAVAIAGIAVACLVRPAQSGPRRGLDMAMALLAAATLPLASAGGWWVNMPADKMVPIVMGLALALALFGARSPVGRHATVMLAAFFLTLGVTSLRNGGPLLGFLALKTMLLGLGLGLLLLATGVRPRMTLLLSALAVASVLGAHRDIPIP